MDSLILRRTQRRAFSLMEMLVVISILAIFAVVAAPITSGVLESNSLSQGGQLVNEQFRRARQLANVRNRGVELRFIQTLEENKTGFQVLQIWVPDSKGTLRPEGRMQKLPPSVVFHQDANLSPLFTLLPVGSMPSSQGNGTMSYKAVTIRPSGLVEPVPTAADRPRLYLTLCSRNHASSSSAPSNYVTIQVNPDAGTTLVYRP